MNESIFETRMRTFSDDIERFQMRLEFLNSCKLPNTEQLIDTYHHLIEARQELISAIKNALHV